MAKADPRKLKDEAAEAVSKGKWKKALEQYLALEKLEPSDGTWPQKAGDMYRRLGEADEATSAFDRAADVYSRHGFLLKAVAVCKLILEIDPSRTEVQARLAQFHAARGLGAGTRPNPIPVPSPPPTARAPSPVESSVVTLDRVTDRRDDYVQPARREAIDLPPADASDFVIETRGGDIPPPSRARTRTEPAFPPPAPSPKPPAPPPKPPTLSPRVAQAIALADIPLGRTVPGARPSREIPAVGEAGIYEIPLGDNLESSFATLLEDAERAVDDDVNIEITEAPPESEAAQAARTVFPKTPLFSSLEEERLLVLIDKVQLRQLAAGDILFRRGDAADALYVVAAGEVAVLAPDDSGAEVEVARLGDGAFFGEIALVADQPRNATIQATADSELLAIDRAAATELIQGSPQVLQVLLRFMRDRLLDTLVDTNPLFAPFSGEERLDLAGKFTFLEADPNAVLVEQGQRASGLFVILAGKVTVLRDGHRLAELGTGDLFGEISLLTHGPAVATIRAAAKTYLLSLGRAAFQEVIMTHPQVLEYINALADSRKADIEKKMAGGAYREGRVRMV